MPTLFTLKALYLAFIEMNKVQTFFMRGWTALIKVIDGA